MFHVPELMRTTKGPVATDSSYGNNGAFDLPSPEPGWRLSLICSDGSEVPELAAYQWEHASVHAYRESLVEQSPFAANGHRFNSGLRRKIQTRTPTWKEMCYVKDLCWDGEDVVVQYHPRRSEYVNQHPNVLHLWRPKLGAIPTPPPELVGIKERP